MPTEPDRIGRYRVLRKLGEGGMGEVYAALDERLGRPVAIKRIRERGQDESARRRFEREARAAASVSHPNVCQLHEIGEDDGALFIAMELLEGEPLSERLRRGPLPVGEAIQVGLEVLSALQALHARQVIHRDVKPSNVFLTPRGVKLLDFGLARVALSPEADSADPTESQLTQAGAVLGTAHYMSPEQLRGQPVDGRADLFSAGTLVFEMLTGRYAFPGSTVMDVYHATLYEQPPALGGSPAVVAVDRVVRRALAKRPEDRYPNAAAMAEELRAALRAGSEGPVPRVTAITRLIVLPFRVLRPDPDTDFLAFSLPDAITSSLSGLDALVVRSSVLASRFAGESADLRRIATEAEVDVVLTGTILRAGDEIRVSAQLVEAPGGAVVWSQASQVTLRDVFQIQDEIVHRIVESLSLPLTAREQRRLSSDVPASSKAYEFYLRANQLSQSSDDWTLARDLYLRSVEEDPRYAPAWARLGRCHRLIGKYGRAGAEDLTRAEAAFRRALELNPDLPIAHNQYAHLEADTGHALQAMARLVARAHATRSDPELFAGLVHVCRYCGLLEASVAADERARRLDPHVRTSVTHTFFMMGDYRRAVESSAGDIGYVDALALFSLGRRDEALDLLRRRSGSPHPVIHCFRSSLLALVEDRRADGVELTRRAIGAEFRDPEARYYAARQLAHLGEGGEAVAELIRSVDQGFPCFPAIARDPWLGSLSSHPGFLAALREAEARHLEAVHAFVEAGGERLLGVRAEPGAPPQAGAGD